jgi:hypothetical protein
LMQSFMMPSFLMQSFPMQPSRAVSAMEAAAASARRPGASSLNNLQAVGVPGLGVLLDEVVLGDVRQWLGCPGSFGQAVARLPWTRPEFPTKLTKLTVILASRPGPKSWPP